MIHNPMIDISAKMEVPKAIHDSRDTLSADEGFPGLPEGLPGLPDCSTVNTLGLKTLIAVTNTAPMPIHSRSSICIFTGSPVIMNHAHIAIPATGIAPCSSTFLRFSPSFL